MVLAVLALVFVVLPLVEISTAIWVSHSIGGLYTVLALVGFSICGAWLAKYQGFAVFRRMQEQVANRVVPTNEIIDAALIFCGGVLLIVPGFVTDAIGLLLLLPPARHFVRQMLKRRYGIRFRRIGPGPAGSGDVIDV